MQGFVDESGLFIFFYIHLFFFCFVLFYTEIQDGCQKWREYDFWGQITCG